jgi:hypothetical protein
MRKSTQRKLKLVRDKIRALVGPELQKINGGGVCAMNDSGADKCTGFRQNNCGQAGVVSGPC